MKENQRSFASFPCITHNATQTADLFYFQVDFIRIYPTFQFFSNKVDS